jgi:DNA-binding NarL/FixJ family response regulator
MRITVLVVDDHAVVRQGLTALLNSTGGIEVVGSAGNGHEALEMYLKLSPDVVLMDLQMPELDGVAATRAIINADQSAQVLVLTSFSDGDRIVEALDAGAVGYLLKDTDPDVITESIRQVNRGESPIDPKAARELLRSRRAKPDSVDLTPREREVLVLVAEGLANKQIARRLEISERTVKAHLTSVFATIGVADRTQAALWAQRHGISD